jgi:hypothetical protein
LKSITWRNYETAQKSGEIRFAKLADGKVFPEKIDPNEGSYNHVVIDVQIEEKIPKDLTGTISFTVLDPMNQCATSKGDRIGSGINDNGTCQMNNKTFSISMTEEKGTQIGVRLSMDPAQPDANFIIAGHPRKEAMEKIVIRTTDLSDKDYKTPIISGGNGNEQIIQTELLTVWRTLWCELDRMKSPDTQADILKRCGDRFDRGFNAKDHSKLPDDGEENHQGFDLFAQPSIPDITLLKSQLSLSCVDAKGMPDTWNKTRDVEFVHNLNLYPKNPQYSSDGYPLDESGNPVRNLQGWSGFPVQEIGLNKVDFW